MSTHYLGRVRGTGDRVYVTLELRQRTGTYTGADHAPVVDPLELSITGEIYRYRTVAVSSAGQIDMGLEADQIDPEPGRWTSDDVASLWQLWRDWHLNGMAAACAHMDVAGLPVDYAARQHVSCPITGERYGSAWWWRTLPADVVAEIRRLDSLPHGRIPEYAR